MKIKTEMNFTLESKTPVKIIDSSVLICATNGVALISSFLLFDSFPKKEMACQKPSVQSNIRLQMGPILFIDID